MSVYNNWYISKAKKFEVKATPTDKGTVTLEVNVYDGLKLDCTPEQWADIIAVVQAEIAKNKPAGRKASAPPPSDDDGY